MNNPESSAQEAPDPTEDVSPPTDEKNQQKLRKELPVVSVPHDADFIAQEMAELFEEDQVTHQHGSSEPEGD